jgi:hypothetical protein
MLSSKGFAAIWLRDVACPEITSEYAWDEATVARCTPPGVSWPRRSSGRWWPIAQGVDVRAGDVDPRALVRRLVGADIEVDVHATNPWMARMLLVDRYRAVACSWSGDAAHLNPPWSGHGYKPYVGDAVNLTCTTWARDSRCCAPTRRRCQRLLGWREPARHPFHRAGSSPVCSTPGPMVRRCCSSGRINAAHGGASPAAPLARLWPACVEPSHHVDLAGGRGRLPRAAVAQSARARIVSACSAVKRMKRPCADTSATS